MKEIRAINKPKMPACSSDGREDGRWAKGETGSRRDAEGLSSSPAVKAGCGDPAVGVFIFRYRVKVVCLDKIGRAHV